MISKKNTNQNAQTSVEPTLDTRMSNRRTNARNNRAHVGSCVRAITRTYETRTHEPEMSHSMNKSVRIAEQRKTRLLRTVNEQAQARVRTSDYQSQSVSVRFPYENSLIQGFTSSCDKFHDNLHCYLSIKFSSYPTL